MKQYSHVRLRNNSAARDDSYLGEIYSLSFHFRTQINNRIGPGYNDIALCKNSYIAPDIMWYQFEIFDIHMSVHRKHNSKLQLTRCNVS